MTTEVLNQLRALRESMAEGLRKDPRYLTLAALDRSIAEIGGVLQAAGLNPPEAAAVAPLHFESAAPSQSAAAPAVAAVPPAASAPAFSAPASAETPAPVAAPSAPATPPPPLQVAAAPAPVDAAPPEPVAAPGLVKKKKSIVKPLVEAAAALAVAGIAAEVMHEHGAAAAKPASKDVPKADDDEGADPAEAKHDPKDEGSDADEVEDDADKESTGADKAQDEAKDDDAKEDDAKDDHGKDDDGGDKEVDGEEKGDEKADEAAVIPKGKASGYTPMQPKAGATQYQPAMSVKFGKLPNKVDLRPLMTPIEDQGDTSSCVANAVAGAYEYWIKKASKQDHNISRLFVYYNARWRDGSQDKDDGSVIQLAMEGLSKFGACNEKVWPFDTHLVLKKPGAEAYQDAAPYKVHDMAQVPLKLEAWKQALAEGKPIVFGCELFDSFDECSKRGGVVPMPAPDDIARKKHSGHSMCAVGYSDTEKVFIVRNSWGADWGDKGYCYMPYAYLMSDKFNDGDCWVFIPKVPSQPPREVWSDDTKPVTNGGEGVNFPIEVYTIADYAKITVDLFEKVRKPFNGIVLPEFSSYVSFAGKGLWSEMESFDFRPFLTSTAALAGVAAVASEFSSSSSTSSSTSLSSSSSQSSEDKESDKEQDEGSDEDKDDEDKDDDDKDDDSDEDSDADSDDGSEDDGSKDDDADEDKDEDADEDPEDDESGDDDADGDKDEDSDEDSDGNSEGGDDDAGDSDEDADEDSEDGDGDDDAEDDESEDEDEDGGDDDDSEDESEDADGGDDDEGGDDDGGGDDGGDDE